jgi:hypothetical protein
LAQLPLLIILVLEVFVSLRTYYLPISGFFPNNLLKDFKIKTVLHVKLLFFMVLRACSESLSAVRVGQLTEVISEIRGLMHDFLR